jgi:hypothetical protein
MVLPAEQSRAAGQANPKKILRRVRGYWYVEVYHYIFDWTYDEDRSTLKVRRGPENIT